MATLSNIFRQSWLKIIVGKNRKVSCRLISTSEKKKEATEACPSPETLYKKVPDFSKPLENNKNWISFGFSYKDEVRDRYFMHIAFFSIITIFFCGLGFAYTYFPDKKRRNWAKREAYIRLHEREQLGLDPIDPNYVDPAKIILPPDEELSDEEIII